MSRPSFTRVASEVCVAAALLMASCDADRSGPSDGMPTPRCLPPAGISGAPTSIAGAVALVNSLPRPVTVGCFLESLDRPLAASATVSFFSLQPSTGRRSPRIFLFFDPLVMSIVPEGRGTHAVEFGQMVSDTNSVKGELGFPIVEEVTPAAPFDRVRDLTGDAPVTICRGCHADESRYDGIDYAQAFTSVAFRPLPRNQVTVQDLRSERRSCDSALEPERCAFLRSLFDHGEVMARDFPANLRTFTDSGQ
ncbi:MAG TPA: hypothetical protein VFH73_08790 [Polyangia bacterium]|nr:hypothetical protein [Polyangia bacterium]